MRGEGAIERVPAQINFKTIETLEKDVKYDQS